MISIAALSCCAPALHAITAAPIAQGQGVDDWNVSQIINTTYFAMCPYITTGLATAGYTQPNGWLFTYAPTAIASSDLAATYYQAWVVTNDPVKDPAGINHARPVTNADAGGADWIMTYTPTAMSDPFTNASGTLHFIQAYNESITSVTGGTEANPTTTTTGGIFLDASKQGGTNTPFYDTNGIASVNAGKRASWMFDNPYDCENSGTPSALGTNEGSSPTCTGGTDGIVLSTSVAFQAFVADDYGTNLAPGQMALPMGITHNVVLYGGLQWGYQYSNADTPEPAVGLLSGALLLLAMAVRKSRLQ